MPPRNGIDGYMQTVGGFESQGKRFDMGDMRLVANVELYGGDLLNRTGLANEAIMRWKDAAERLTPLSAKGDYSAITSLARVKLRLGQIDEARALAARVRESNYRHPAFADLMAELANKAGSRQLKPAPGRI
jgi:hypothetical protein